MELTYEQRLDIALELMTKDSHDDYAFVCSSLESDDPETIKEWKAFLISELPKQYKIINDTDGNNIVELGLCKNSTEAYEKALESLGWNLVEEPVKETNRD